VLSVGATDAGNRAAFSNHGSWVSVGAPGVGIHSTTPVGGSTLFPGTSGYDAGDGTSFASPIVAGEAALLSAYRPSMTAQQIKAQIEATADHNAALDLGNGRVNFANALTHLPPTTVPSITAPTDGSTVSDEVSIVASSTAPAVQFLLDGTGVGTPVTVAGGTATLAWTTSGIANGAHTWAASDCNADGCGPASSATSLTLANAAPTLTAPLAGAVVGSTVTLTATAPSGGVAFYVDNIKRGFDGTAPYTFTLSGGLAEGAHNADARSCNSAGTLCNGPSSAPVSFTVNALHPAITAVAPNPFSPNGDGKNDATKFTVKLPDAEAGSWQVRNQAGALVRGPYGWATLPAGSRTYSWDGRTNSGTRAPDDMYTIVVLTSGVRNGVARHGYAAANVRLDTIAPSMYRITGNGTVFYPYPDGYADRFGVDITVNEPGYIWLYVRNAVGTTVRVLSMSHASAGTFPLSWDGRNTAGAFVPAGTYGYFVLVQDMAGNRRRSGGYTAYVSLKRLANTSVTLTLNGNQAYGVYTSDESCTQASYGSSSFPAGLWLANLCLSSEVVFAGYQFSLAGAVRYNSVNVYSYGNTISAPEQIAAGIWNYATNDWDVLGTMPSLNANYSNSWARFGTVDGANRVSAGKARIAIVVPSGNHAQDYDIGLVRIAVSYTVLH
jgi:flagellar hook assembly protein FlgD